MHCGELIRLLRNYKKISQAQLAQRINKSQRMISHKEQQEHLNGKDLDLLLKGLDSTREEWELFKKLPHPRRQSETKKPGTSFRVF